MFAATVKTIFSANPIKQAAARAERRNLYGLANYTKVVAANLIKRGKTVSRPGSPPKHHAPGRSGLKFIRYAVDLPRHSAIIGPVKYDRPTASTPSRHTSPALIEFGGSDTMTSRRGGKRTRRRVRFRKRPFMSKALERVAPKIPPAWAGTVHAL